MNKQDLIKYKATRPVAPGETILEILENRGITQAELAKRLDRPLKTLNGIIKGKVAITPETALQLEQVLGIPAGFWNNLESQYQETRLRIESNKQYQSLIPQSKIYPYLEMVKNGWLESTTNPITRVKQLLSFFSVTDFDNIVEEAKLKSAFRISTKSKVSIPAVITWLRKGSMDGEHILTQSFDVSKVRELIPQLRSMTLIEDPNVLMKKLKEELSKCGIAFVITKNLTGAPINGATRWIGPDKALIQMSIRWHWADIFWFSLFHELGHIILDNKKDFNVDFANNHIDKDSEFEKDKFARDNLIPPNKYQEFLKKFENIPSYQHPELIRAFAKHIEIHPGVVVGRLQHEGKLPYTANAMRVRFSWAK